MIPPTNDLSHPSVPTVYSRLRRKKRFLYVNLNETKRREHPLKLITY